MYRFVATGVAAVLVGFFAGWKVQGWRLGNEIATIQKFHVKQLAEMQEVALSAEKEFREKERQYVASLTAAQEQRNAEIARINRRHTDAINSLRNRPERSVHVTVPGSEVSSAPTACVGSTGAELARGDAEFLAGEASRADQLRAALRQCLTQYEAARQKLKE